MCAIWIFAGTAGSFGTVRPEPVVKHLPRPELEKDAFSYLCGSYHPCYEILFSHYADTRLATIYDRTENYRSAQIIKMVLSSSPEEVKRIYSETLQEMKNGDYELWKTGRRTGTRKPKSWRHQINRKLYENHGFRRILTKYSRKEWGRAADKFDENVIVVLVCKSTMSCCAGRAGL